MSRVKNKFIKPARMFIAALLLASMVMLNLPVSAFAASYTVSKVAKFAGMIPASKVFLNDFGMDNMTFTRDSSDGNFFRTATNEYYGNNQYRFTGVTCKSTDVGTKTFNNPFSVKFTKAGFTTDGTDVDVVLKFNSVQVHTTNGASVDGVVFSFGGVAVPDNAPSHADHISIDALGITNNIEYGGAKYDITMTIYKSGTSTVVKLPSTFMVRDLDHPDHTAPGYSGLNIPSDYVATNPYNEAIRLVSGFDTKTYLTKTTFLQTADSNAYYYGSQGDEATNDSTVVATMPSGTSRFIWTGSYCGTDLYGADSYTYPDFPEYMEGAEITKTAPAVKTFDQTTKMSYDIKAKFPYVVESAAYPSIVVADTLSGCFDMSKTTMKITDSKGADKTSAWAIAKSGQKITATMTGQSKTVQVFDDYTFTITTALDTTRDMSKLDGVTVTDKGWSIANIAYINELPSTPANTTTPKPAYELVKSSESTATNVGETVNYTLTAKQTTENATAPSALFTDTLPQAFIDAGGSFDLTALKVTDTSGSDVTKDCTVTPVGTNGYTVYYPKEVAYNETLTVTYPVTFGTSKSLEIMGSSVENKATVEAPNTTPGGDDNTVGVYTPHLAITKAVDKTIAGAGSTANYTVVVTQETENSRVHNVVINDGLDKTAVANGAKIVPDSIKVEFSGETTGTAATEETATDQTDVGTTDITKDCDITASESEYSITTNHGLAYGENITVTYQVTLGKADSKQLVGTTVKNTATAVSDETPEPVEANANVKVVKPEISITKEADKPTVAKGGKVNYTINVANINKDKIDALDVSVVDRLSEEAKAAGYKVDYDTVKVTKDGKTFDTIVVSNDDSFTVALGTVKFGEKWQITYVATGEGLKASKKTNLLNVATVSAKNCDDMDANANVIYQPTPLAAAAPESSNVQTGDAGIPWVPIAAAGGLALVVVGMAILLEKKKPSAE